MPELTIPDVKWTPNPKDGLYFQAGFSKKIVLHTTETPPITRGGNPERMALTHGSPPQLWYDWEADQGWQSIDLLWGGYALWRGWGPHPTNAANAWQVELIGYSSEVPGWPDVAYERIARRVIRPLYDLSFKIGEPINLGDDHVPLPGAIPNSARSDAPQRLDPDVWAYRTGLCGHRHVPMGDDHWDPGSLDLRRLARMAVGSGPTGGHTVALVAGKWFTFGVGAGELFLKIYEDGKGFYPAIDQWLPLGKPGGAGTALRRVSHNSHRDYVNIVCLDESSRPWWKNWHVPTNKFSDWHPFGGYFDDVSTGVHITGLQ